MIPSNGTSYVPSPYSFLLTIVTLSPSVPYRIFRITSLGRSDIGTSREKSYFFASDSIYIAAIVEPSIAQPLAFIPP